VQGIVKSANAIGSEFWNWWIEANAKVREKTVEGRLVVKEGLCWDSLMLPGKNGLLGVVACLMWWRDILGTVTETKDWDDAVVDVAWACRQLTSILRERSGPEKGREKRPLESVDDNGDGRSGKRFVQFASEDQYHTNFVYFQNAYVLTRSTSTHFRPTAHLLCRLCNPHNPFLNL
jgi:hypothetical protein